MSFLGKVIGEKIDVRIVQAPDLKVIHADPTQLQQVFMNLCLNARDAMPEGGQLKIQTRNLEIGQNPCLEYEQSRPGDYVLLMVSDTGSEWTNLQRSVFSNRSLRPKKWARAPALD